MGTSAPRESGLHISLLLAAHNGRAWLPEQFASILDQEQVKLRVQVSLDISTDGSEQWLREQAAVDSRIVLLPVGEHFGSAARNFYRLLRDADLTDADAVALADQDDIWRRDRLARAWSALSRGYAGYSSDVEAFWPDGRRSLLRKSWPQKSWDFLFESAGPGCTFVLSGPFARQLQAWLRDHWDEVQAVNHHDWLIYAFARARGLPWLIDDYPGVAYRQHSANELGARVGLSGIWRRASRVWRGEGFDQARRVAMLIGLADHPFVRPWHEGRRLGFLRLGLAARQCRRYWLDQGFFAVLCFMAWIRGA